MSSRGGNSGGTSVDPPDSAMTFDHYLPMMHSYLGQDLEEIPGRTVLDDWSFYTLPLHVVRGLVLVPGQTLPLNECMASTVQMLKRCIETDHLFGSIGLIPIPNRNPNNPNNMRFADVGTVAEIYECRSVGNGDTLCVKAIGRQRFRLLQTKQDTEGLKAKVQILPEIVLPDPMTGIRLNTLNRYRGSSDDESNLKKLRSIFRREAMTSQWPGWVFSQFRISTLVGRVKELLREFHQSTNTIIPKDPVALSFWLARAIPLDDEEKVTMLRLPSAIMRLQYILKIYKKHPTLCCSRCHSPVANQRDIFSMSVEGALGAYVNSNGFIHETITVTTARNITLQGGPPTDKFSWFPGYAWRIAECEFCSDHLGWRFTAVKSHLKPASFWALARRSIETRRERSVDNDEDDL